MGSFEFDSDMLAVGDKTVQNVRLSQTHYLNCTACQGQRTSPAMQ